LKDDEKVKYSKIKSIDELELGKYYWCVYKKTGKPTIEIVGEMYGNKYLGYGKVWASKSNNKAFEIWDIYGPIPLPKIGD